MAQNVSPPSSNSKRVNLNVVTPNPSPPGGAGVPLLRELLPSSFHCLVKILSHGPIENDLALNRIDIRSSILLISTKETHHFLDLRKAVVSQYTPRDEVFPVQVSSEDHSIVVTLGFHTKQEWCGFLDQCRAIAGSLFELDDFVPIATIGRGKFGKVTVSQKGNQLYAVKEVNLSSRKVVRHCQFERIILTKMTSCDFVVGLDFALHRGDKLYFIMEFCPGGDLFTALMQFPLTAEGAVFFSTEVLLALQSLHNKYIVYRDLKPENLLLDAEGHIKLADLGLAKIIGRGGTTNTLCGTEVYVAPETLGCNGYGFSADFWQFGCFVYELYSGHSPFYKKERAKNETRDSIMSGSYEFPAGMPSPATALIKGLLQVPVRSRLGCRSGESWSSLKSHQFFSNINWDEAEARQLQPPFKTVQPGSDVLRNFDEEFINESPRYESSKRSPKSFADELQGFDYCSEWHKENSPFS
jgi:serine/threonine protein kinase